MEFANLSEYCKWRYEHDPDYKVLCDATKLGYRGEKHAFVMSIADAKQYLKDHKG